MPKPASNDTPTISVLPDPTANTANPSPLATHGVSDPSSSSINNLANSGDQDRWDFSQDNSPRPQPLQPGTDNFDFSRIPMQNNFTWEMIGLGLEEPLPPQESIDELSARPALCPLEKLKLTRRELQSPNIL